MMRLPGTARAAVLSPFACPPLLNIYSGLLLLKLGLGDHPLSRRGTLDFYGALVVNLIVCLMAGLFFSFGIWPLVVGQSQQGFKHVNCQAGLPDNGEESLWRFHRGRAQLVADEEAGYDAVPCDYHVGNRTRTLPYATQRFHNLPAGDLREVAQIVTSTTSS